MRVSSQISLLLPVLNAALATPVALVHRRDIQDGPIVSIGACIATVWSHFYGLYHLTLFVQMIFPMPGSESLVLDVGGREIPVAAIW